MSISNIVPTQPVGMPTPVQPIRPVESRTPAPIPLAPAVRIDIGADEAGRSKAASVERDAKAAGPSSEERRITVDEDTRALVYQLVDLNSGDVVVQLPEPTVLKARAYAEAVQARTRAAEHPLDRTA